MEYKFDIGEKVRCLKSGYFCSEGDIVTVSARKVEDDEFVYAFEEDDDKEPHWLYVESGFESVFKFKIGDKIKLVKGGGYGEIKKGDVVTVSCREWTETNTSKGDYTVYGFEEDKAHKHHWLNVDENFKLVKAAKKGKKKKAKPSEKKLPEVDQYQVLADIFGGN